MIPSDLIGRVIVRPPSLPGRGLLGWFLRGLVFGIALRLSRRIPLRVIGWALLAGAVIVVLTIFFHGIRQSY